MKYRTFLAVAVLAAGSVALGARPTAQDDKQAFRFRTGIELINVTATVTDASGRFVPNLRREDFRVYQDDEAQPVTYFSNERVPVSLGIALDTSGSMAGEKMAAARAALNRFLHQLLDPNDEVFLYRFDSSPQLIDGWTTDRRRISEELARIQPRGGTALYDTVAEAVPLAQSGRHRKKALVVISDGHDTSSQTDVLSLKQLIRETEVLVYAIGIDAQGPSRYEPFDVALQTVGFQRPRRQPPRPPIPLPFPKPGGVKKNPPAPLPPGVPANPPTPQPRSQPRSGGSGSGSDDRVNVAALRDITDDSGGRTEIIRSALDLDPATAGIADELSKQYYLAYASTGVKDGRWHTSRVEVRNPSYRVRARRGFVATP